MFFLCTKLWNGRSLRLLVGQLSERALVVADGFFISIMYPLPQLLSSHFYSNLLISRWSYLFLLLTIMRRWSLWLLLVVVTSRCFTSTPAALFTGRGGGDGSLEACRGGLGSLAT